MASPTYEVLKVVAVEGYQPDWNAAGGIASILSTVPGFIAAWQGLDVQDAKHLWLVIAWETIEHHRAFMADKEKSPMMLQGLFQVATAVVFMNHVTFSRDLAPVLDAPLTEFAIWTLKEGADRAGFLEDLAALHEQLKREIPDTEMIDGGWGAAVEDERKFFVGLGWHSLERCTAAVAAAPNFIAQVRTAEEKHGEHAVNLVKLLKYPGA
ncbi:hypothetical protein PsYK624_043790 [Phanerochaete sordida]|uniref:ABM domain-containing protein n=1 Tax=Phanerochaete sordida TaxID=48140 RepID=A0A9P3G4T1_9APHY|nr:hypothetical protein PsYK624_043790 [Phanerochaete sordida]